MNTALGIDVEVMDPERDVRALSEAAFDARELDFMRCRSDATRTKDFYRIWTMKEALFKLFSNTENPDMQPAILDVRGELQWQGDGWSCAILEHPHLAISIGSTQPLAQITRMAPPALATSSR